MDIMDRRIYFEKADDAIRAAKHSLFKLELLDEYNASFEKSWKFFKRNGYVKQDLLFDELHDDLRQISQFKKMGIEFRRVHIVTLPLSEYLRFEIQDYITTQKMGEQIYFIERKEFGKIAKPRGIRLIDLLRVDDLVFLTKYANVKGNVGGDLIGGFLIYEQAEVKKYKEYEKRILKKAVPMDKFLKRHQST